MPEIILKDKEKSVQGKNEAIYNDYNDYQFSGIYLIHIPLQGGMANDPSSYFPHYNYNMSWIGLREKGWERKTWISFLRRTKIHGLLGAAPEP